MVGLNRLVLPIASVFLAGSAVLAGCTANADVPVGLPTAPPSSEPTARVTPLNSPSPSTPSFDVPRSELLFEGKLLICSDLPYPPQEFFDSQGNPVGSDIEIGQELARRLGLEAEIINSIFDTILDALDSGKCDIVISAQTITAERLERVEMVPYFQAGATFLVQRANPAGIHTELDLCGKQIAAQSGTVMAQMIEGKGDYRNEGLSDRCTDEGKDRIELRAFEKDDEAVDALAAGDVDAYFLDSPVAGYHVIQGMNELELSGLTLDVAVQGISIPKDEAGLLNAVRYALDSMMNDGTYVAILARYGVQDGSVAPPAAP